MVKKLDGIPIQLPKRNGFPQIIYVNFRIVASTNVERVGWDVAGNMYVQYKAGGLYAYLGVGRQRAVAAAYAKSVGAYVARNIKHSYKSVRVA